MIPSEAARQYQLAVEHERHARDHGDADDFEAAVAETAAAFDRLADAIASAETDRWDWEHA